MPTNQSMSNSAALLLILANVTASTRHSNSNDAELTFAEFCANFFVQPILCLIGSILNLIICAVFAGKAFPGAAYLYMAVLSLADAGALLCVLPFGLLR